MMSRVRTRHLVEMAGLASTTYGTRRRKSPALLCGFVGWLDTADDSVVGLAVELVFGLVWLWDPKEPATLFQCQPGSSARLVRVSDRKRHLLGSGAVTV